MWLYTTKVGVLWIRKKAGGGYLLGVDDELLGTYQTAEQAAGVVSRQKTGFSAWDNRLIIAHPKDLSAWVENGR